MDSQLCISAVDAPGILNVYQKMELAFVHLAGLGSIVNQNVKMENMELAVFFIAIVPPIPYATKLMVFVHASLDLQERDVIKSVRKDITEQAADFAVTVTRGGLFLVTMKQDAFAKLVQLGKGNFSYMYNIYLM